MGEWRSLLVTISLPMLSKSITCVLSGDIEIISSGRKSNADEIKSCKHETQRYVDMNSMTLATYKVISVTHGCGQSFQ